MTRGRAFPGRWPKRSRAGSSGLPPRCSTSPGSSPRPASRCRWPSSTNSAPTREGRSRWWLYGSLAVVLPGESVGLRHAVVGEVLLARLTSVERRRLHSSLALALERSSRARPERLAHHWSAAGDEERAGCFAVIAADRFESHRTYRTATDLYGLALRHPPADHLERAALYERAAAAAALAGAADVARRWAAEARRSYGQAERPWLAGRAWVNPTLDARADHQEPEIDLGQTEAAALLVRSQDAMRAGDLGLGRHLARRALEWAREHEDHAMASFSALAVVYAGEVDEGRAVLEDSVRGGRRGGCQLLVRPWAFGYLSCSARIGGADVELAPGSTAAPWPPR